MRGAPGEGVSDSLQPHTRGLHRDAPAPCGEGQHDQSTIAEGPRPPGATGALKDIAPLVLPLTSDKSRFVTGSDVLIKKDDVTCRHYRPPAI